MFRFAVAFSDSGSLDTALRQEPVDHVGAVVGVLHNIILSSDVQRQSHGLEGEAALNEAATVGVDGDRAMH